MKRMDNEIKASNEKKNIIDKLPVTRQPDKPQQMETHSPHVASENCKPEPSYASTQSQVK